MLKLLKNTSSVTFKENRKRSHKTKRTTANKTTPPLTLTMHFQFRPKISLLLIFAFAAIPMFANDDEEEESVEDDVTPPVAVYKVDPSHPQELFDQGIEGHAVIIGTVDMFGSLVSPVVETTTHDEFGIAAILACSEWIFEPATKNGVPIEIGIKIPFSFEIAFEHALNVELQRKVFLKLEEPVMSSSELDFAPSPRFMPVFDEYYPEKLKGSGVAAALSIEFVIGPDGLVYNPQIISASTKGFEEAALRAVSLIKYNTISVNGEQAYVSMKMPVHISE